MEKKNKKIKAPTIKKKKEQWNTNFPVLIKHSCIEQAESADIES